MTVSDPASDERDKFAARAREYIGEMSREVERDEEREAQVKAESLANIARNAKAWDVWLSWVAAPQSGRGPAPTKPSKAAHICEEDNQRHIDEAKRQLVRSELRLDGARTLARRLSLIE